MSKRREVPFATPPRTIYDPELKHDVPAPWVASVTLEYWVYPGDHIPTLEEVLDNGHVVKHAGCAEDESKGWKPKSHFPGQPA
jgi:hypothetical protein